MPMKNPHRGRYNNDYSPKYSDPYDIYEKAKEHAKALRKKANQEAAASSEKVPDEKVPSEKVPSKQIPSEQIPDEHASKQTSAFDQASASDWVSEE